MLETIFSATLLARAINAALALDPAAQEKLSALNGRRIRIALEWPATPWVLAVENGEITLPEDSESPCDVRLSGTLAGLLQLFQPPSERPSAPRGKLYIEGDLYAAQQFQRVMGDLKPDFEAILKRRFGEQMGEKLAAEARRLQEHGATVKHAVRTRAEAFLQASAASRSDNAELAARISTLQERLSRLEKRVAAVELPQ